MSLDLFELLKSYCRLDTRDSATLGELLPRVRGAFPRIIDEFYLRILEHAGTRRVIQSPEQLERLKGSLLRWLEEVFRGPYDAAYYEKRRLIGIAHVRVGLSQVYVFGAMSHIRRHLETAILSNSEVPIESRRAGCAALAKVLDIDLALIAGSYHEEEKYRDLVEHAPDMIHEVDRQGRIRSVNVTGEKRLGYSREQLLSMNVEDLVVEEDRPTLRVHLQRVFTMGQGRCELAIVTSDGSRMSAEVIATAVKNPITGEIVAARAYWRDITERVRMEKTLVEQASLARLGEMAAVVAHEVKNPLAGIGGALQVIAEQLPRGSSGRDMVEEILERLDALNDTVNDLLLFARPRLPSKEPVPVLSLIEDTIALMRSDPSYRNVTFRVSGEDVVVQAEAELLKPALMNVLINAAQAVGSGGQVVVEVASSNGTCSIFVQDNGPGISPELREKVFEPFFSTKHRGTGLGLPITKRIIEVHGGEISMSCPSSGGTSVSIRLPVLQVGSEPAGR